MYVIPLPQPGAEPTAHPVFAPDDVLESPRTRGLMPQRGKREAGSRISASGPRRDQPAGSFQRRQFSSSPTEKTNTQIGIAVAVTLGLFLVAACTFLYVYRSSIRCRRRRRPHHMMHPATKSSRSSASSSPVGPAAAPEEPA
ncbi:hypothetical protein E4U21_002761 [Claviceps maximensis]|nr:hypothetical protein E4U21_002761 [Claviceps maximensis]